MKKIDKNINFVPINIGLVTISDTRTIKDDKSGDLLQNKIMETTSGTQSYDFMHVDDVAAAFAALLDSPAIGAVNIASGVDQPLTEILQIIGNQIGDAGARALGDALKENTSLTTFGIYQNYQSYYPSLFDLYF